MFGIKKKRISDYDKENQKPAIRISICTGEKVAGFMDKTTGKFADVMLIRNDSDLARFCRQYRVDREDITSIY